MTKPAPTRNIRAGLLQLSVFAKTLSVKPAPTALMENLRRDGRGLLPLL
ncbi:hypothetical protein [Coleofasciculus sp. G2-EDA-02]